MLVNEALLGLIPKRYLCPNCGEWHDYPYSGSLDDRDSVRNRFEKECVNAIGEYSFYFRNGLFFYTTRPRCKVKELDGQFPVFSFAESKDKPIVTLDVDFKTEHDKVYCAGCDCRYHCNYYHFMGWWKNEYVTITLGFEFDKEDYEKVVGQKLEQLR